MPITDIIDKYGEFSIITDSDVSSYKGKLIRDDDNIGVELIVPYKEVDSLRNKELFITGRILSKNVALIRCLSMRHTINYNIRSDAHSKDESYIVLMPTEIIYDYPDGVDPQKVNGIQANINQLCCFVDFGEPYISLFKSRTGIGEVSIIGCQETSYNPYHSTTNNIVRVSIDLIAPATPDIAVQQVSSIRNLFSFFTDYYLDITDLVLIFDSDKRQFAHYHMNYQEKQELTYRYGLLPSTFIWDNLTQIYNKWRHFSMVNQPLVWLYYQILCNHSVGVNSFLNQCQALELYSSRTPSRNAVARELYKSEMKKCSKKTQRNTPLSFRLYDLFLLFKFPFPVDKEHWLYFAKKMSTARNYFTHFPKDKCEPSHIEIAAFTKLSRLMLINVVYTELEIPLETTRKLLDSVNYSDITDYLGII